MTLQLGCSGTFLGYNLQHCHHFVTKQGTRVIYGDHRATSDADLGYKPVFTQWGFIGCSGTFLGCCLQHHRHPVAKEGTRISRVIYGDLRATSDADLGSKPVFTQWGFIGCSGTFLGCCLQHHRHPVAKEGTRISRVIYRDLRATSDAESGSKSVFIQRDFIGCSGTFLGCCLPHHRHPVVKEGTRIARRIFGDLGWHKYC